MSLDDYLRDRYTPQTAAAYLREIRAYLLAYPAASTARYRDIASHLGVLRRRYSNPSTLNRILCSIKVYYDYLHARGVRADNPARGLRLRDRASADIHLQDLLSAAELAGLMEHPERYGLLADRNRVLIGLFVCQALLPYEAAGLVTADVDLEGGALRARGGAKTHGRRLPLAPSQMMPLYRYLSETRPRLLDGRDCASLLISARGAAMAAAEIAGHVRRRYRDHIAGRRVTAQVIRQSVIALKLKAGGELRAVQVFAGHKRPTSTERYKQSGLEELRAAIDRYHPQG